MITMTCFIGVVVPARGACRGTALADAAVTAAARRPNAAAAQILLASFLIINGSLRFLLVDL